MQGEPFPVEVYASGMSRIDAAAFPMQFVDYWRLEQPGIAPYQVHAFGPEGDGLNISSALGEYVIGLGDCYGLGSQDRVLVARLEFLPYDSRYNSPRHYCYECETWLDITGVAGAAAGSETEPVFSDCSGGGPAVRLRAGSLPPGRHRDGADELWPGEGTVRRSLMAGWQRAAAGLPVLLVLATLACGRPAPRMAPAAPQPPGSLPAYAHNDYENPRPLRRALELGYRGVEADFFLVEGELRVGHDRGDLRPGRTLEALYLGPLREALHGRGALLPGGAPFLLNLEDKDASPASYRALDELLARYGDILLTVVGGVVHPGPVVAVMVGGHPPVEQLWAQEVRRVAVQLHYRELPGDHRRYPVHLARLISVEYGRHFRWRGEGATPPAFTRTLAGMVAARDAVPGRLLRVHAAPGDPAVYRALLRGGVDLIGTKHIERDAPVLARIPPRT